MKKVILPALLFVSFILTDGSQASQVSKAKVLGLQDAISIGLRDNPDVKTLRLTRMLDQMNDALTRSLNLC